MINGLGRGSQPTEIKLPSLQLRNEAQRAPHGEKAMTGETLEAIKIQDILAALPHRYPFLMVDRIIDVHGDERGIGIKNVTANEPQFLGHFPNNPVMPGILILEGMAQTAGTLCIRANSWTSKPNRVYFLTIDKAKFRKPVIPGDTLEYHVRRIARRKNMWWFRGEAKVVGEIVAEAELGAMIAES
jgi:3-hydroxyacyl-[acyl-carrier-protein] dehydratase